MVGFLQMKFLVPYIFHCLALLYYLKTRAETRVFLKSETKTDRKLVVKSTLQFKLSSAFCKKVKIAGKKMSKITKRDLSICCLLKESASILEQTSRSYGGLKLGLFVTK